MMSKQHSRNKKFVEQKQNKDGVFQTENDNSSLRPNSGGKTAHVEFGKGVFFDSDSSHQSPVIPSLSLENLPEKPSTSEKGILKHSTHTHPGPLKKSQRSDSNLTAELLLSATSSASRRSNQGTSKEFYIDVLNYGQGEEIFQCVFEGNAKLLKTILFEEEGNANAIDHDGISPLMQAAAMGRLQIMELLIEAGADIDWKSNSGSTALICAAMWQQSFAISLLLRHGVNAKMRDSCGRSAMDYALSDGAAAIKKYLIGHMFRTPSGMDHVTNLMKKARDHSM